jgi:hypothetical protein
VERVGEAAEREREPEDEQPIGERRDDGLVRGCAGQCEQAGETGLDEAESARREPE